MNSLSIRLLVLAVAPFMAGCATSGEQTGAVQGSAASVLYVCHGTDCNHRTPMRLTPADHKRYASIMARGRGSAAAERQAVSAAIQYFEKRTTAMLGRRDTPMSQFKHSRVKGEMDCIDEGTNTDGLLQYLQGRGLLRHHKVERVRSRGFILDNQFPHVTATMREKGGTLWAVDSWPGAGGAAPEIMPYDRWSRNGNLDREWRAAF